MAVPPEAESRGERRGRNGAREKGGKRGASKTLFTLSWEARRRKKSHSKNTNDLIAKNSLEIVPVPTDYKIDRTAENECSASRGFSDTSRNWHGVHVGNVTVNCKVTWVLSWFPHANMTPIFINTPVWYK